MGGAHKGAAEQDKAIRPSGAVASKAALDRKPSLDSIEGALQMQRSIGNRAAVRLTEGGYLQRKLSVAPAGDTYEREADDVADEVMRNLSPTTLSSDGNDGEVRRSLVERTVGLEGGPISADAEAEIGRHRGSGTPLPEGLRLSMGQSFGADFSAVRVHTGPAADELSRSMEARAFTVGSDIFLGRGQYRPDTPSGQRLLAHELTHTVQQGAVGRTMTPVAPSVQRLDDETEAAVQRARLGGRPLDAATREPIQRAMGADFSAVRIHADGESERLNRSLDSEAFTTGSDIFIRPGSYRRMTPSGQRLFTHELAHIVQQGGASPNPVQAELTLGPAHGPLEAGVEKVSCQLSGGAPLEQSHPALMRQLSPGGRGFVQRYTKSTKDYTTTNTDVNVPNMFTTQSIDPKLTAGNQLRHDIDHDVNPRIYFSDDYSIGINKAKMREAKEFYATDAIIDTANQSLLAKGSAVVLIKNGNVTVDTPQHGTALKMVKPTITPNNGVLPTVGDLAHFGTSICIDVAQKVMGELGGGRATQAVFRPQAALADQTEDFSPGGQGDPKVYKAADFIAGDTGGDTPTIPQMKHAMNQGGAVGQSAKAYGKNVGSRQRIARARELAVNEFARPRVGEGFAAFSTRPRTGGKTWGYHYAGVVARSGDGNDWVTLENYNRTGDIQALAMKLYNRLLKQNKAVIDAHILQLETALVGLAPNAIDPRTMQLGDLQEELTRETVGRKLKELMAVLAENAGQARAQGEADYAAAINTEPRTKWFFHLYGSNKGQSFHEQAAKSGYFENPLTLRVRKP